MIKPASTGGLKRKRGPTPHDFELHSYLPDAIFHIPAIAALFALQAHYIKLLTLREHSRQLFRQGWCFLLQFMIISHLHVFYHQFLEPA
jgi:hypothetical protein